MEKFSQVAREYKSLHEKMCADFERADGTGHFEINNWEKKLGSGSTRILENGRVIEKGAINYSRVSGKFTPQMESLIGEKAHEFSATGISSIIHPKNPWMPIIHMNIRYFWLDNGTNWFGGGIDLTPHIVVPEDAQLFHKKLKSICGQFHPDYYSEFKTWADNYFYLPHRKETRGVGGIFFDRLKTEGNFNELLDFTKLLGIEYPKIYAGFIEKYATKSFSEREKNWQLLRRGRYVEFNLIYDRGTKFGLESGGNTESILASLPANASWNYNYKAPEGGFEQNTLSLLKKNIDWLSFVPEKIVAG